MSKINAVRIINLNYNNNAIRISDEIFELNGESTLLSLQNGGGKSVLVQMMMAPFVHKRYLNAKDRPFSSYFTSNKPTFIMVEWKLDGGGGYVLAGMMVRKNQETQEDNVNELEMINFIGQYKTRCKQDIYHLAVVEKNKKEVVLKNFSACKQLLETHKKEREIPFFYYDMNNSSQMKQYFDKLLEYKIDYKEWETIIKKINLKESGLSDLFHDCKDEKGLVEKWFLESVQNKLNKEKNRMQEFQSIVEKYVMQYKENQSKIMRRDAIRSFETEAEQIMAQALDYQKLSEEKSFQEAKIADFITKLNCFLAQEEKENESIQVRIKNILDDISHLEYEKISGEIYEIEKMIHFHLSNREMIQLEKDDLEKSIQQVTEKIHLLICAHQQEKVDDAGTELEDDSQKLSVCMSRREDLEPERNSLGSSLKHYYNNMIIKTEEEKERCLLELTKVVQEMKAEETKKSELADKDKQYNNKIVGIKTEIKSYDKEEDFFNKRYQANFNRNILGDYEPGLFEITKQEYEKNFDNITREKILTKRQIEESKENLKILTRNLQDTEGKKIRTESQIQSTQQVKDQYQSEIKERKIILKYFDLEESLLFSTAEILAQSERIRKETEAEKNLLMLEDNMLQKEYKKLTQGQVLEISPEFKKMLEEAGISYVYGMDWLSKNQKSVEENRNLIRTYPLLPYALIMSKKEMNRLTEIKDNTYTSSPVPIVVRESIEQSGKVEKTAIQSFQGIAFYIWFNENLLDEEKRIVMIEEKERQILRLGERIKLKSKEYNEYFEKQEQIRNQRVTKELYENTQKELEDLAAQMILLEEKLAQSRQEKNALEEGLEILEKKAKDLENNIIWHKRYLEDFLKFADEFKRYEENRILLQRTQKELERVNHQQKLCEEKINKLENRKREGEYEKDNLLNKLQELCESQSLFKQYQDMEEASDYSIDEAEAAKLESRYRAITSDIFVEQRELEERVQRSEKRRNSCIEELNHLRDKYRLTDNQWKDIKYNRKEEQHQEIEEENLRRKIEEKNRLIQKEREKIIKDETRKEEKYKELKKECNCEELLPRDEIQTIDFAAKIKELEYQKEQLNKQKEATSKKINGYEEVLISLAEYSEFVCSQDIEWEADLSAMSTKELGNQKGMLVRDYNSYGADIVRKQNELSRLLGRISRMEQFQDSFYQKPIEALMELIENASLVIRQLETILQSFGNLMEKLLVDISFVEKEKAKVLELLEDYLKEVHSELGKIDHNSTITIREKSVKMLKIGVPDWETNESIYQLRLQDYLDHNTEKCIQILNENANAGEFLGTRITTKALYDAVVGISNVQIRMYKIEAQREYPITWSDVAKNSGGEGFLSAFVILSSLLYYMRKDDSDIFADRNEGKVLLMDNPFAQTNAAHLLKPLMEVAKRTNTQLICLTGLGGESIYNRFDNIYVLNLIAANLRGGMQYLKADHKRGTKEETMIVSQIEVIGQQEMVF